MSIKKLILGAALSAGALVAVSSSASAYVVCNREGDCWHTETRAHYPGTGYTYHPDDWYFHQTWNDQRHYRDYHKERGYYKGGVWLHF